jgi:hypothetical protein
MPAKEDLHELVDRLTDEEAQEALEYVRWLSEPTEALSKEELDSFEAGEEQIASGDYVTLDELPRFLEL